MEQELKTMVLAFRVTELQTLLGYAGRNKTGRKNELQARALELIKQKSNSVANKVKELYKSMQASLQQPPPASASIGMGVSNGFTSNNFVHPTNRNYGGYGFNDVSEKAVQVASRNPFFGPMPSKMPGLRALELPICPDVRMRNLPFYDIVAELHKPSSLISQPGSSRGAQEATFPFCLTPSQAADIAASKETIGGGQFGEQRIQYMTQVQLRFCVMDTSAPQDDQFPGSLVVKVNNKPVQLPHPIPSNRPGVEAKRPSKPLNITNYVKISPTSTNSVSITWAPDASGRTYVMSLYLVKKLCSQDLLTRLKNKGIRPAEYTKGMIKDLVRLSDEDCIATTSFKVSVACPLGKCKMDLPCRSSSCKHLQCFDGRLFIQMNEKKPTWSCPVCDKLLDFNDISIDGYFDEVIKKLVTMTYNGMDIEVQADGTWKPLVKRERDEPPAKRQKQSSIADQTINLDDDLILCDDDTVVIKTDPVAVSEKSSTRNREPEVIDLTLSSDEDEPEPPRRTEQSSSAASSSKNNGQDTKEESSDDDEANIRRPRLPRAKKPESFYIDDSSSSSTSSSSHTPHNSIPNGKQSKNLANSKTPDIITLDSRTPSPEPRPPISSSNSTSRAMAPSNSGTVFNNSSAGSQNSNTNAISGAVSRSRAVNGTENNSYSMSQFSGTERSPWENNTNANPFLPSTTDFSSLDFPSMDFFNASTFSQNQNGTFTNNSSSNSSRSGSASNINGTSSGNTTNGFTNWRST